MSDVHVRELERRWSATRAVADEVALVAARLRAGTITRERLELAASCANAAAVEVLGGGRGDPTDRRWSLGLVRFGVDVVLRHDVAWVGQHLPHWQAVRPDDPVCAELVAAIEDHVTCPCPQHVAAVARARTRPVRDLDEQAELDACADQSWSTIHCPHPHHRVLSCARSLGALIAGDPEHVALLPTLGSFAQPLASLRPPPGHDVADPRALAIGELVSWALGHDDALLARVTERAALRESAEGCTVPRLEPSPEAAAALRAAEARAKVRPGDLPTLVDLVHRSELAGWTLDGRPISELRATLADARGTVDQDRRLAALLRPLGPRAVPLALEAIRRHDSRAAFFLLEALGTRAAAAVPAMLELLGHTDGFVRVRAGQVLAAIGKPAVSPLRLRLPELSHPGGAVFALLALGEGPWTVEGPLLHAFNQNDEATWSLLFELQRPGALAPAAPALRALAQSPLTTAAVRARCEALFREL